MHLRAAPIYRILASAPGLVPAGSWLRVRRGVTTNWNAFFYPVGDDAAAIEPEYLLPVLRSPRGHGLLVDVCSLPARLFSCQRSEDELRALGHRGAIRWIEMGRAMTTGLGIALPDALSHRPWYSVRPSMHRVVLSKAIHDTHRHLVLSAPAALDQRLYGVSPLDGAWDAHAIDPRGAGDGSSRALWPELVAAALNSSLTALSAEVVGTTSLGEGALDLPVGRVEDALLVPDARRLDARSRAAVLDAFRAVATRPTTPAPEEVRRGDRCELDRAWLVGLGLPVDLLPAIHEALVDRVTLRLERARSVRGVVRSTSARAPG